MHGEEGDAQVPSAPSLGPATFSATEVDANRVTGPRTPNYSPLERCPPSGKARVCGGNLRRKGAGCVGGICGGEARGACVCGGGGVPRRKA